MLRGHAEPCGTHRTLHLTLLSAPRGPSERHLGPALPCHSLPGLLTVQSLQCAIPGPARGRTVTAEGLTRCSRRVEFIKGT